MYAAQNMSPVGWIVNAIVESILFLMVFVKAREDTFCNTDSSSTNHGLLALIAKDSILYFAMCVMKTVHRADLTELFIYIYI